MIIAALFVSAFWAFGYVIFEHVVLRRELALEWLHLMVPLLLIAADITVC